MSAVPAEISDDREEVLLPKFNLEPGGVAVFDASRPIGENGGHTGHVVSIGSNQRVGKRGQPLAQFRMDVVHLGVQGIPRTPDGKYAPVQDVPDMVFGSPWLFITGQFNPKPMLYGFESVKGCATIKKEGLYAPFGAAHNSQRFTFPRYVPETWFAAAVVGDQLRIANIGPEPLVLTGHPIDIQYPGV